MPGIAALQNTDKGIALTASVDHPYVAAPAQYRRLRQQRAKDTKAKILLAAARSFAVEGYAATSLNDILAVSGSTKGAVYFHFDSKEAIAGELVNHWAATLESRRQSAIESDQPALTQLATLFSALAQAVADDALVRAGLRLTTEAGLDSARIAFHRWVEVATGFADAAIADGQLPNIPPSRRLAMNLCAGFIGAIQVIQVIGDPGDFTARIGDLLDSYLPADSRRSSSSVAAARSVLT